MHQTSTPNEFRRDKRQDLDWAQGCLVRALEQKLTDVESGRLLPSARSRESVRKLCLAPDRKRSFDRQKFRRERNRLSTFIPAQSILRQQTELLHQRTELERVERAQHVEHLNVQLFADAQTAGRIHDVAHVVRRVEGLQHTTLRPDELIRRLDKRSDRLLGDEDGVPRGTSTLPMWTELVDTPDDTVQRDTLSSAITSAERSPSPLLAGGGRRLLGQSAACRLAGQRSRYRQAP